MAADPPPSNSLLQAPALPKGAKRAASSSFEELETQEMAMLPADVLAATGDAPLPSIEPATTSDDPTVGKVFGLYRVVATLGEGAMASVYRATHTNLGGDFALKLHTVEGDTAAARFRREAGALLSMKHPNIVAIVDYGTTPEGLHFLVMEHARGDTFHEMLEKRGKLPEIEAAQLGRQIAEALDAAHRAGFIHRDLKPANVICVPEPGGLQVKLLDFGVAGLQDNSLADNPLTVEGERIGTPGYMAPEVFGEPEITPKADLYALGVMLYEMLTGGPPFDGPPTQVLMDTMRLEPPPIPGGGPLADLSMRLLQKEPDDRPDASETLQALRVVIDPNAASVATAPTSAAGVEGSGPSLFLLVGGALLTGLIIGGLLLFWL